jgi:sulfate permease, SulP family
MKSFRRACSLLASVAPDPFPLRHSLVGYGSRGLAADLRAGLNVALLGLPQGMAYALIAGVPLVYGVACSIIAAAVAPLFSRSRFTVLGPTNATALMVMSFFASHNFTTDQKLALLPLLTLLVGAFLIASSTFRLADMVQYVSRTVIVGYITGAAFLIIANQLPTALGLPSSTGAEHGPATFFSTLFSTFSHLADANLPTLALSLLAAISFLLANRRFRRLPSFALALVAFSTLASLLSSFGVHFSTFGQEDAFGLADLIPRQPDLAAPNLLDQIATISGLAFAIAFLAAMENTVMAKTLASRSGDRVDANQDLFGLGMANVGSAFLGGMPASGSLTRSALNFSSGAASPLASFASAAFTLLGAIIAGPLVPLMPRSVLSALVICIAISLINPRTLRIALRSTRSDAITLVATFAATLLMPLHVAIFVGVGTSVALYLRKAARPELVEYEFNQEGELALATADNPRPMPSISIVHVEGDLFFGAAELFRSQIQRISTDPNLRIIVLRLKNARHLDATSVMALEELIAVMRAQGREIIVSGVMKDVYRVLKNSGLAEIIGRENIHPGSPSSPNRSTRNALKRAQEILGTQEAEVHIYFDPNKKKS